MRTTTHVEWLVLVSAIYLDLTLNSFIWIYYNKYIIYIFKYIIVDSPVNHVEIYSRLLSCNQVIVSSFKPIQWLYRCWWLQICWWQVSALVLRWNTFIFKNDIFWKLFQTFFNSSGINQLEIFIIDELEVQFWNSIL